MGEMASLHADRVIITNDNPRSEMPEAIVEDILQGIKAAKKPHIELDREKAIAYAIQTAKPNDYILVAGKGHEIEQIIGQHRAHFSDEEVVKKYL